MVLSTLRLLSKRQIPVGCSSIAGFASFMKMLLRARVPQLPLPTIKAGRPRTPLMMVLLRMRLLKQPKRGSDSAPVTSLGALGPGSTWARSKTLLLSHSTMPLL